MSAEDEEELESHAAFVDPIEVAPARLRRGCGEDGGQPGDQAAHPAPQPAPAAAPEKPAAVAERWVRFALVPGLELPVREGGRELAGRMAEEIRRKYGG